MPLSDWVVIRVEASNYIGFGHMVRCFALASSLTKKTNVIFFTDSEFVAEACIKAGFNFKRCSDDIAGLRELNKENLRIKILSMVIDTKSEYSADYVNRLKGLCKKIFFIENISRGTELSDGIIFPAAHFDYHSVYGELDFSISSEKLIFGEKYILIRDELKNFSVGSGGGIVVTTGASDPAGVMQVLDKILNDMKIKAHFLLGEKFELPIMKLGKDHGSVYTQYSVEYISKADLIISAFGVSVYESLFFKKPTISVGHNLENAKGSKIISQMTSMVKDLGFVGEINALKLKDALDYFKNITFENNLVIDGRGSERISQILLQE